MNRRLVRCRHDRVLAGVASGVAEYFDVDPTIVRVLWLASVFFGGLGLLLYIVMAVLMPIEPEFVPDAGPVARDPGVEGGPLSAPGWHSPVAGHRHVERGPGRMTTFVGFGLILFGALALVGALLPDWADQGRFLWPAFILGIGALLVASAVRREPTGS